MRYDNKFFATKEEAQDFKRRKKYGRLVCFGKTLKTRIDFYAEMSVAEDARGEYIDPEKTPYCVAWNVR